MIQSIEMLQLSNKVLDVENCFESLSLSANAQRKEILVYKLFNRFKIFVIIKIN